jgi:hypothetical protein
MWFKKNIGGGPDKVEPLSIKAPVEIAIGSTGKVANTKAMVEGVAERKLKNPQEYNPIFKRAEELAYEGRAALEFSSLKKVGELMNENHRLLQEIEVQRRTTAVDVPANKRPWRQATRRWRRLLGCIDARQRVAKKSRRLNQELGLRGSKHEDRR